MSPEKEADSFDDAQHKVDTGDDIAADGQLLKSQCSPLYERAKTLYAFARLYLGVYHKSSHVKVRKDNNLVAANFPAIGHVDLYSPAFLHPESISPGFLTGIDCPTKDDELDYFINSLASRRDWITCQRLDFCSEDGRSLPVLFLSSSFHGNSSDQPHPNKLRVWIQAAVHGNEPAGDQAALCLLGKMDADEAWTTSILNQMDILMLPRYNPDGVAHFRRTLLSGIDLNRDHVKFASDQTRNIKKVFNDFAPHIAVDMHEYSAPMVYDGQYRQASDALFSVGKNLNIHPSIRQLSETMFTHAIAHHLEARGFRWEPYVTGRTEEDSTITFTEAGSDAKMGRNAMGLTQCITLLTETRGIGLADQHFHRRTAASLTMVEAIIQTAADHTAYIHSTIERAVQDFINSTELTVVVTDTPQLRPRPFSLVNITTGHVDQVPVQFYSTTPTTPTLTRARPEAYLIPARETDLAARLGDFGLQVTTLTQPYHGPVETFTVTNATYEDTYFEGVVPVAVTTELRRVHVDLGPGAFWISTRQKNAALAAVVIEPESRDSWVRTNIVPVGVGALLPLFRVMVTDHA